MVRLRQELAQPWWAWRAILDEVYRRFDRRGRPATALPRPAQLRARGRRFQRLSKALDKLTSPPLDQALRFLGDALRESTSTAVARGNRRFRKAQRRSYSVRTAQPIRRRLDFDFHREQRATRRAQTLKFWHQVRSERDSEPP